LPAISPLGPSPIDIDRSFDIPEAQHPLPESLPASPSTLNECPVENTPESSPVTLTEELKRRSSSILGDRQENDDLCPPTNGNAIYGLLKNHPESPPSSPQSFVTSNQELLSEDEGLDDTSACVILEQERSVSRVASAHNVLIESPKPEVNHEVEPGKLQANTNFLDLSSLHPR
jgi:hypothetical protein